MVLHPALHVKTFDTYGFPCKGLFVRPGRQIHKGEHVWWLGDEEPGRTFTKKEIQNAPSTPMTMAELAAIGTNNEHTTAPHDLIIHNPRETLITYSYMLDDDRFSSTPWPDEDVSYCYNHSCDPNTGYRGDNLIVALRDIGEDEQVLYDYGFTETQDSLHRGLACKCGAATCRGILDFLQYKDPIFIKQHYDNCTSFIQRKMRENGWVHDSVVRRHCFDTKSYGLFAMEPIPRWTPVISFAGKVVSGKHVVRVSPSDQERSIQIDTDLWQVPGHLGLETGDFINHSCDPNCGMGSGVGVTTMRDIATDEALTLDYAMVNSAELVDLKGDWFSCQCGSKNCRGTITASDYKTEGHRFLDFLSPFVREKYLSELRTTTCGGTVSVTSDPVDSSDTCSEMELSDHEEGQVGMFTFDH